MCKWWPYIVMCKWWPYIVMCKWWPYIVMCKWWNCQGNDFMIIDQRSTIVDHWWLVTDLVGDPQNFLNILINCLQHYTVNRSQHTIVASVKFDWWNYWQFWCFPVRQLRVYLSQHYNIYRCILKYTGHSSRVLSINIPNVNDTYYRISKILYKIL